MNDQRLRDRFVRSARLAMSPCPSYVPEVRRPAAAARRGHASFGSSRFALVLAVLLLPAGISCDTSLLSSLNLGALVLPSTLTLRIENATSSFANVTVTPGLTTETSSSESTTDSTGSYLVRVSPASLSLGSLTCAATLSGSTGFVVSATVGSDTTKSVLLSGHGTGTPGFDDGSIGTNGERYLIRGTHYTCGDTIVVRITSDGSGSTSSSGSTARGQIERYAEGEAVPTRSLTPETTGDDTTDGGTDTTTQEDVAIRIANQTAYFMKINVASAATEVGQDVTIYVPPGFTTNGDVTCDSQYKLTVTSVDGTMTAHVVLTGDGTGVAGFDNGSIGPIGDRTLIRGDHFSCGDRVTITITNPGQPNASIDEAVVGAGTVAVSAGS